MTIGLAFRTGENVELWTDFAITDQRSASVNSFPGRLKCIILNRKCTIAYAGDADRAIQVIQNAFEDGVVHSVGEFRERLRSSSEDGAVEYLLVSHNGGVSLRKIFNGVVSEEQTNCAIGDVRLARRLTEADTPEQVRQNISELFCDEGFGHRSGVGGFLVQAHCRPDFHFYPQTASTYVFDSIDFLRGETEEQKYNRAVGATELQLFATGVGDSYPVFGVYFSQANKGYVYRPLLLDVLLDNDPRELSDCSQQEFREALDEEARAHIRQFGRTAEQSTGSELSGKSSSSP